MVCRELRNLVSARSCASLNVHERLFSLMVPRDVGTVQVDIDVVPYGGTVAVAAGVYDERVVLSSGVTLIGAGASETVILNGCEATDVTEAAVYGVGFGDQQAPAVLQGAGRSTIIHVLQSRAMCSSRKRPSSFSLAFANSRKASTLVYLLNAGVHFEDCTMIGNGHYSVQVSSVQFRLLWLLTLQCRPHPQSQRPVQGVGSPCTREVFVRMMSVIFPITPQSMLCK